MSTPKETFEKIGSAAEQDPEVATSVDGIVQFNVTGEGGGSWVLNLEKGRTTGFVSEGTSPDAKATLTVSADDWSAMFDGELDPMTAFMSGKIKVDGDIMLAMKLQGIMKLAR